MFKITVLNLLFITIMGNTIVSAQQNEGWTAKTAKKWVEKKEWSNGLTITPHKSVNIIKFADQYHKNKEMWDNIFRFLKENDLTTIANGQYNIEKDKCWITVSEYFPKTLNTGNIESHRRFIDLQYVVYGNEKMGLVKHGAVVRMPYNEKKDVEFYNSDKINHYQATPDKFFLFFPGDIHQPSVSDKSKKQSKKIVFKIEYIE